MRGLAAGVLVVSAGLALAYALCPRPDLHGEISWSRAYHDRDGGLLRLTLAADEHYRLQTPLAAIAPAMVEATLLYEDRHFRMHPGVNPVALARAFISTYLTGTRRLGGSTITMQLARNLFLTFEKTVTRKAREMILAVQIEQIYTKDEILAMYLNQIYMGQGTYGMQAASRLFFGKDVWDLQPGLSAFQSGRPGAPPAPPAAC